MTRLPFDICRCLGVSSVLGVICQRRDECLRHLCLADSDPAAPARGIPQAEHLCTAFDDVFIPAGKDA